MLKNLALSFVAIASLSACNRGEAPERPHNSLKDNAGASTQASVHTSSSTAPPCKNGTKECDPWNREWTHDNTPKPDEVVSQDGSITKLATTSFISCEFPSGKIDYRLNPSLRTIRDVDRENASFEMRTFDDARVLAIIKDRDYIRSRASGSASDATMMLISINRIDGTSELTAAREPRGKETYLEFGGSDAIVIHSESGTCKIAKAVI